MPPETPVSSPAPSNTSNNSTNPSSNASGSPSSGSEAPTKQQLDAAINTPSKTSQTAAHTQNPNELFEVKVNGKIVKMTRAEVVENASLSYAAQSKFDEAAKMRKTQEKFHSTAKTNVLEALMDPALGLTKDQIRDQFEKWYHQEYIVPESLSPQEQKLQEYEKRIKTYEDQEAQKKAQIERENEQKMTAQDREHLQTQIIEAIDRSGLPKTPSTVKAMAFLMRQNLLNGWDAPIDYIIRKVKTDRQESFRSEVKDMTPAQIIDHFGDDLIGKIRAHDLQQLREKRNMPQTPFSGGEASRGTEKVSYAEVQKRLNEMRRGK
jgi:hypothetical protein